MIAFNIINKLSENLTGVELPSSLEKITFSFRTRSTGYTHQQRFEAPDRVIPIGDGSANLVLTSMESSERSYNHYKVLIKFKGAVDYNCTTYFSIPSGVSEDDLSDLEKFTKFLTDRGLVGTRVHEQDAIKVAYSFYQNAFLKTRAQIKDFAQTYIKPNTLLATTLGRKYSSLITSHVGMPKIRVFKALGNPYVSDFLAMARYNDSVGNYYSSEYSSNLKLLVDYFLSGNRYAAPLTNDGFYYTLNSIDDIIVFKDSFKILENNVSDPLNCVTGENEFLLYCSDNWRNEPQKVFLNLSDSAISDLFKGVYSLAEYDPLVSPVEHPRFDKNTYYSNSGNSMQRGLIKRGIFPATYSNIYYMEDCQDCGDTFIAIDYYYDSRYTDIVEEIANEMGYDYTRYDGDFGEYCPRCQDRHEVDTRAISSVVKVNGSTFTYKDKSYEFSKRFEIGSYNYMPDITFLGGDGLHLGTEIEIDKGGESDSKAAVIVAALGYDKAWAMHDGSLDYGFEIGVQPATLEYHMTKMNYKDTFDLAVAFGYRAHDTSSCGLHVHVDRSFFGKTGREQNLKAAYMALIMEKNWEDFIKFSRRDYSRVNNWAKKKYLKERIEEYTGTISDETLEYRFRDEYDEKYVALNTLHRNTYEFRIFKGTLLYDSYIATLQFVSNLSHLAKALPDLGKAQLVTFKDIIDYKPWPELVKYCQERGFDI